MGALAVSGARRTRHTSDHLTYTWCCPRNRSRPQGPVLRALVGLDSGPGATRIRDLSRAKAWVGEQQVQQIYTIDVQGAMLIGYRPLFTPARRYAASRATPI